MIAFCEPRSWGQDLCLHYLVREEHVVERAPGLLFGEQRARQRGLEARL
jgi:hypothetical protein